MEKKDKQISFLANEQIQDMLRDLLYEEKEDNRADLMRRLIEDKHREVFKKESVNEPRDTKQHQKGK